MNTLSTPTRKLSENELDRGRKLRHAQQRQAWLERVRSIKDRQAKGMTLAQIAAEDGVTPQAIHKALKRA